VIIQRTEPVPTAVFVHLGPKIPKHLLLNLQRQVDLFPHIKTVLIVDHAIKIRIPEPVEIYSFVESREDSVLFQKMQESSDFGFRSGFWKYTFLRLFALGDYHDKNPENSLLHIESDVILLPNFPWKKFHNLENVAWMRVNDFNDIAALVYLPSHKKTRFFIETIRGYAEENPKTTDMFSMFKFSTENKATHSYLPSITPERLREGISIKNGCTDLLELFGGYFDPLALGLWYFGQDPKNTYGVSTRYVDQTHHDYFAPNAGLTFENNQLFDTSGIKVFALHVHSKDLAIFGPEWRSALSKVLSDAQEGRNQKSFAFRSFVDSLRDRSARAHFWLLLARLPGLKYLQKISLLEKLKEHVKRFFRIEF
jgi:hypothetical protein